MAIEEVLPQFQDIIDGWGKEKEDRDNNEDPEGKYSEILYERIAGWEEDLTISDTDKLLELIPHYSLYDLSTTIDNKMSQKINRAAIDYLRSCFRTDATDIDIIKEWKNKGSYFFNTLFFFMDNKEKIAWPDNARKDIESNIFNVITGILKEIAKQELEIPDTDVQKFFVGQTMIPNIKPTIKNIRDDFINKHLEITPPLFLFFAPFLEKYGGYKDKGQQVTIREIPRTILTPIFDDEDCMNHIIEQSATYIPIILNAQEDAADFKNKVREKSEQNPDNLKLKEFLDKIESNNFSYT